VIAFRVAVPDANASKPSARERGVFVENLLQRLRNLPQVRTAAASSIFPLDGSGMFTGAGKLDSSTGKKHIAGAEPVGVTEGFFPGDGNTAPSRAPFYATRQLRGASRRDLKREGCDGILAG